MAGLAGQQRAWLAEVLPPHICATAHPLHPGSSCWRDCGHCPSWLGERGGNGGCGMGRVNAERFLPRGVNSTECMFAFICILKHILKAPRLESSVFYSIFL